MAKITFTAPRVAAFKCPLSKFQAFIWDASTYGLGLRATSAGRPSYVFQSRHQGSTIRLTIGSPDAWSIPDAQGKAREFQRCIDQGKDPRDLKRDAKALSIEKVTATAAKEKADRDATLTTGEVWAVYLSERKERWGDLHYRDHEKLARAGGMTVRRGTRGTGTTIAMPLHPLMCMPLRELNSATIEAWAAHEAKTRPTSARLAWRLLKGFLSWCVEQPLYACLVSEKNPAKTKKAREALGKPSVKSDALERGQLKAWFESVQQIQNPVIAAALQVILLTGARPGEVLSMRWEDVDVKWRGLKIRDKVEGTRTIPLTPHVLQLFATLPRPNDLIFSSTTARAGALTAPRTQHVAACKAAGISGLTLHGLRRSFKSLTEWLEIPAGVVAQIMGHKPSATAEKHYTVRPLDLLRLHHEKIEAWILKEANVQLTTTRVVPV